jgi:hypothetical protein
MARRLRSAARKDEHGDRGGRRQPVAWACPRFNNVISDVLLYAAERLVIDFVEYCFGSER